ncbi:MAG TPA: tRNA-uridine aminocarboxypropyltransferase [Stellaceae bacterium]|nr:tRNA-uridine aminocarboxypropyltransferase [Stellaceae bacterium]
MAEEAAPDAATAAACARCRKPSALCVCAALAPVETRHFTLILQHPQERDEPLGTAWLAHLQLRPSRLVAGLSWPSLTAALGRPASASRWGVFYLGAAAPEGPARAPLTALGRRGAPLADQAAALAALDGIILLDGSWSEAKALWWRNPWLLKARRLVLAPPAPSLYGKLRREPRRDSLATIEAAAFALAALEGDPGLPARILAPFALLLDRYRATQPRRPAPGASPGVANRRRRH